MYKLLDSGDGQKLEQFGDFLLVRPCGQALWRPALGPEVWNGAHALFTRDEGNNKWRGKRALPDSWIAELKGLKFKISATDFGHLGLFPEHSALWEWMEGLIKKEKQPPKILNLFAYSGGATLAAAKAGASVCHLDASQGMVKWARENAALNGLEGAPIRWIVDDVIKFLMREEKRGVRYDGIILDPPSFGRGKQGEVFKIERDLNLILDKCCKILSDKPLFLILSSHTQGITPLVMRHLLEERLKKGKIEIGEMSLKSHGARELPSGSFARWTRDGN